MIHELSIEGWFQPVDDHESAAIVWVACHEGFRKIVQTCPVNHNSRSTNGVNQRAPCSVAKHIHVAALCSIHESLTHIAMNHQLPIFHDLRSLILSSTVNRQLTTINAGRNIVADIPVTLNAQTICSWT